MADATEEPGPEVEEKVDGRRARRERNRLAVVDAVLEMFSEEMLVPSIEAAAERSGLSLRSVYRYFPDPEALLEAVIERTWEIAAPLAHLEAIGEGPLDDRLDAFVTMRVHLLDFIGPTFRATVHHQANHERIRADLNVTRRALSEQFERQFAAELDALTSDDRLLALAAGDLLTQFESFDHIHQYRGQTLADTAAIMTGALRAVLRPGD